jgi:mono/diheme cytochrome c family protein
MIVVGVLYAVILWASPRSRLYHPREDQVPIPSDANSIARGKHLVEAVAVCTICHGENLGGKLAFDDPFLGHGYTANLTRGQGGIAARYSATDWVRSIRYGVRPDGRGIIFMPSDHYNRLSDQDLGAIIAYLLSLPAVDNLRTSVELNPLAGLLIDVGVFGEVIPTARIDFDASRTRAEEDPGAYLVDVGGCTFCHGPRLTGGQGPEPGAPAAPDLTANGPLKHATFAAFAQSMRSGVGANGRAIEPKYMPWLGYRHMTDEELAAIWRFCGHGEGAEPAK